MDIGTGGQEFLPRTLFHFLCNMSLISSWSTTITAGHVPFKQSKDNILTYYIQHKIFFFACDLLELCYAYFCIQADCILIVLLNPLSSTFDLSLKSYCNVMFNYSRMAFYYNRLYIHMTPRVFLVLCFHPESAHCFIKR